MYTGNHPDAIAKIYEIQNKGRTKSSPLDHIALPLTFFFMVTDLMTVHLYTESLFDERPEMAMLVAASIALLLDACPMLAGKLKGQLDDMLPRDQRATKRRISALLGTAVGAFAIFAGFCIVSTLMGVETLAKTEDTTLYMVGQFIRMLLPIATSVGSYAVGYFSDHRSQLEDLKAQLLDQLDAAALVPQLNGVPVEFYGLGDVAGSQRTLSAQQVQWLQSFWQAFFDRTGATVTFHADIVSGEALTENGHKVTPLAPAGAPTFIKVSAEQVDFQPDSTAFLDEDAARSALNELATQLKADSTSYVVAGSTAEVDNASREGAQALSLARARAVRDVLVVVGIPADQITCLGLGNEPTSVRSANEAENRCVYVVSSDSVQATEFRSVGQAES